MKLLFDGGTLKANADNAAFIASHARLVALVTENGGAIDAAGHTITITEDLAEDSDSPGGGMTFKGGGTVTFTGAVAYTGVTTVEVGTSVVMTSPAALNGGLAVTLPTDRTRIDGEYMLFAVSGDATLDESVITGVVLPERCSLRLSQSKKSIYCTYGIPPATWIGGASGSLSDPAGWNTGVVPVSGSCTIGNDTEATLTVGETFKPEAITFPSETALVTIEGPNAIIGILSIVNESSFHHVFNCPVTCPDGVTPSISVGSGNYMKFAGGITMHTFKTDAAAYWSGNITLTTEDMVTITKKDWMGHLTGAGSVLTAKNVSFDYLVIEQGTTGIVEKAIYNGCRRGVKSGDYTGWCSLLTDQNQSVLKVGEVRAEGDCVLLHSYNSNPLGVIEAAKLTQADRKVPSGDFPYALFVLSRGQVEGNHLGGTGKGIWAIGPGGLSFDPSTTCDAARYSVQSGGAELHSYADWELADHPKGSDVVALEIVGANNMLTIDTSHYTVGDPELDSVQSHVVTLRGKVHHEGKITVCGCGKVVFANPNNSFTGGLTVSDTATAEVLPGCSPGAGDVSVENGATLKVAASGTVALGGNLTLGSNAVLAFNFTEPTTAPVLGVMDRGVAANGMVKIAPSATGEIRPKPGRHALTSGGGFAGVQVSLTPDAPVWGAAKSTVHVDDAGDIVLDIPLGTAIFLR